MDFALFLMKLDLGPTRCFAINRKEDTEELQRVHPSATWMAMGQGHITDDKGPVYLMAAYHCLEGGSTARPSLVGSGAAATSCSLGGFRQGVRAGSPGRSTWRWCSLHPWRQPNSSRHSHGWPALLLQGGVTSRGPLQMICLWFLFLLLVPDIRVFQIILYCVSCVSQCGVLLAVILLITLLH